MIRILSSRALLLMAFATLSPVPALAQAQYNIEAVPTNWRMQDYTANTVNLYYTGSSCTSGSLVLSSSAPDGSKDRLWSLVLTAKLTNRPVGIFYHVDASGNCMIDSFYMD